MQSLSVPSLSLPEESLAYSSNCEVVLPCSAPADGPPGIPQASAGPTHIDEKRVITVPLCGTVPGIAAVVTVTRPPEIVERCTVGWQDPRGRS